MSLLDWLVSVEARELQPQEFIEQLGAQVRRTGCPVEYISFSVLAMHPELVADNLVWSIEDGVKTFAREQKALRTDFFMNSPVYRIFLGEGGFRQKLTDEKLTFDFPILRELQGLGYSDYLIEPLALRLKQNSYIAWSTKEDRGFTSEQLSELKKITPYVATVVAAMSHKSGLQGLLNTYLGHQAGEMVRSGQFHKGDGTSIDAVIWFSDLRGFTEFADNHDADATLERLNCVFDIIGNEIYERGGDILKFIGDAVLAVFPITDGSSAKTAAQAAISAAKDTVEKTKELSFSQNPIKLGIGLHRGRVSFGNIGSRRRLDFTIIGAPVNEASRIESLCKQLGEDILLSEAVADLMKELPLRDLGLHTLRGVKNPKAIFAV